MRTRTLVHYPLVLLLLSLMALPGCKEPTVQDKATLAKQELGLNSLNELDYENLDHLVFMHKHASETDKQISADSVTLAREMMADGNNLFARVEYVDAISAYPTPEIVLAFANGFLNIAQTYLDRKQPDLSRPINNNDIKWYFQGAVSYYQLALKFSARIGEAFAEEDQKAIRETMTCIDGILKAPASGAKTICQPVRG